MTHDERRSLKRIIVDLEAATQQRSDAQILMRYALDKLKTIVKDSEREELENASRDNN